MSKKEDRFLHSYLQKSFTTSTEILIDRETGVNYLVHESNLGGGITPLLDRDGKPVVSALPVEEE